MQQRANLRILLLAAVGAGCSPVQRTFEQGGGGGGAGGGATTTTSTTTATTTSTSSGTGGGACVRTVNGTETEWFLANGGMTATKPDLSGAKISILAGPSTLTGTGNTNGTFSVSDVPCGEYYLTYLDPGATSTGATVYYLTSSSAPDMSRWVAGRSNVTAMTMSTPVTVSLTDLDPWANSDSIQLASINAGIGDVGLLDATASDLASGATAFTGTFDASQVFSPPNLIEAAQQDHVVLFQRESNVQGNTVCTTVARSAVIADFTMSSGAPATVTAALAALPQTKTATINWATTQYEKLAPDVSPSATVGGHYYTLTGYLGVPTDGIIGSATDLLSFTAPNGTDVTNSKLAFGDPFSGVLYYVEQANTTFLIPVAAPTATPTNVQVFAKYYAPQATFEAQTVVPLVSPVTSIVVDGQPGFTGGALSSTTPTISFSAPVTGTPTHYTVEAIQLVKTANGGTTATDVGEIWGDQMSIQLPQNLLVSGSAYVFRIDALVFPGGTASAETEPRWIPFPYAFAEALTGVFTTP